MFLIAVNDPTLMDVLYLFGLIVLAWMQQRVRSAVQQSAKNTTEAVTLSGNNAERSAKKAEAKANVAVEKVEEVKQTLADATVNQATTNAEQGQKLDDIAKTGQAVHVLVNSAMSVQLKINMVAMKRIADLTNHPDDVAAAALAAKLYNDHEDKQALVDKSGLIIPPPK